MFTGEDSVVRLDDWLLYLERTARWNRWTSEENVIQVPLTFLFPITDFTFLSQIIKLVTNIATPWEADRIPHTYDGKQSELHRRMGVEITFDQKALYSPRWMFTTTFYTCRGFI